MGFNLSDWWTGRTAIPQRSKRGESVSRQLRGAHTPYHAVAVQAGPGCCGAALELKRQRFLSRHAPTLPLSGCTADKCTCVYAHYDDRRSGKDRRLRVGRTTDDRRVGSGRREDDY